MFYGGKVNESKQNSTTIRYKILEMPRGREPAWIGLFG